jgi:two-component system, OmpR family, response regulator RegX3
MTRILVVEDEESFRDALSYMLRREGFEVELVDTAARLWSRRSTGTAPTWCCWT